jgi:large subunit ribosomal protein L23
MSFVKPRLSEKSYALSKATNTFAFDVPGEMNSVDVANEVKKQFGVEVVRVRLVNRKGKVKRVMNLTGKRSSNRKGTQNDRKKAYVTLAAGSHLPFFEAAEKEAEAAKKAEAKKAEKKADDKPKVKGLKKLVTKKEAK